MTWNAEAFKYAFFFFGDTGAQTQSLVLARQELLSLEPCLQPFLCWLFLRQSYFMPGLAWMVTLPSNGSCVVGMTGVSSVFSLYLRGSHANFFLGLALSCDPLKL
jgi:hypothetical protein